MAGLACALLFAAGPVVAAPPLAGRAYELADQAYKAIEAQQLDRALSLADEAIALAPGHPSLLMLQADVLSRQGRHAEAYERLRALPPQDLGANGLAQRGYLALGLGNAQAGEADLDAALRSGDLDAQSRANVARELAALAIARQPEPAPAAGAPLTGRAHELADEAYKALEAQQLDRALALATEAMALAPGHPSLLILQADVLSRQGRHAEAYERLRAVPPQNLGGDGLAQRGYLALRLRNPHAAEADFIAAMRSRDLGAETRANLASELAYLALARKDDAAAERWFRTALEARGAGASRAALYADAGYLAIRRGQNERAIDFLSRAVDEWHAAPADKKPFGAEDLYAMRRAIDTLSRRFGATFSVGHGSVAAGSSVAPGALGVLQAGAEVFYRPPVIGYRDGRVLEIYANGFQALHAEEATFPTGSESRIAGVGVRYKPLREVNLVLALERRFAVGERAGEDDWLLRAGWSAGLGTDWQPVPASWFTWQVYTESVYFIDAERLVQPFEARAGYSWKLPWSGTVLTPFVGAGGEYDRAQQEEWAAGAGPGIALRHWFRETRHRAYASYLDFSLQYRFRMTEAQRGEGWFGLLSVAF